jgi:hypothetical protein
MDGTEDDDDPLTSIKQKNPPDGAAAACVDRVTGSG